MNYKQRVTHRLKIVRGHLDKVIHMMDEDRYCIDILTQSQAVQAALKEVDVLVLENHLQHCAANAIKGGRQDEAVAEVLKIFRKSK